MAVPKTWKRKALKRREFNEQQRSLLTFFSFLDFVLSIEYLTQIATEKIEFGTQFEIEKNEIIEYRLIKYRALMENRIDILNELKG